MKKVGVIGLGIMGQPMAENLLKAGFEVYVFNRTASKAELLVKQGAVLCSSPAEVASHTEAVLIMVRADAEVEEMVLGTQGIVKGAKPGLLILNSSTILPKTIIALATKVADNGLEVVDCPVTGSRSHAEEGALTFIVGASKQAYDRSYPILKVMGKKVLHMGEVGAGAYAKLANNTMVAINLLSMAEALIMVSKSGVNPKLFLEVISGGGARSATAEGKMPKIFARDFEPAFSAAMLYKDLKLASNLAEELDIPTPVLALVKELVHSAVAKGYGDEDICSIIKCYEELAGVQVEERI